MGELYRLDFPNGKGYVGITATTAEIRFRQHVKASKKRKIDTVVDRAINKYKAQNVTLTVLDRCDDWSVLGNLERWGIAKFGTAVPNGYNVAPGGEGVLWSKMPEEARERLSASARAARERPGAKERHSTATKKAMNNPEMKERLRGVREQPEVKERQRKGLVAAWAIPGAKKRRLSIMKTVMNQSGVVERRRQGVVASWADPDAKERRLVAMKAVMSQPGVCERRRAGIKAAVERRRTLKTEGKI